MKKIICLLMIFVLLFLPTSLYASSETSLTLIEEDMTVLSDNFMEFVKHFMEGRTRTIIEAQNKMSMYF